MIYGAVRIAECASAIWGDFFNGCFGKNFTGVLMTTPVERKPEQGT